MAGLRAITAVAAISIAGLSAASAQVTVTAERVSSEPLLRPSSGFQSFGLFNPTAITRNGKTVLLYRAQDTQHGTQHTSRIGYAESADGVHFVTEPDPVLSPEAPYEKNGGVEDPRLVQINGLYYLTYTGYNTKDAQLCLAISKDLRHWDRKGVILPAYKGWWNTGWTKSGAIIPRKIEGKWWMYYLGTKKDSDGKDRDYMGVAVSSDLLHWSDASDRPVLDRRPQAFDSRVMEPGPTPIVTPAGILLLYNGADEKLVYGPGWALFDRKDPTRLIARSEKPFLLPELPWEKIGNVPNVIFLEGAVHAGASALELTGYYGAADKYIGAMRIHIAITPHTITPNQ